MENGIQLPKIDPSIISKQTQAEIKTQLKALYAGGTITKIENEVQAQNALAALKTVKAVGDETEKIRKGLVGPLNEQVKEINGIFKEIVTGIYSMESTFKSALAAYQEAEHKKQVEAQKKADAEAEARRLKELEEAQRLSREAQESAAKAHAAEISGDHAGAAALLQEANSKEQEAISKVNAPVDIAPVVPEAPKLAGFSTRTNYKAEVQDEVAFFKWAAKNEEWGLLEPNQKALNKLAAAKGKFFKADGCRLISEEVASVRK
jgi:hypothetical protein